CCPWSAAVARFQPPDLSLRGGRRARPGGGPEGIGGRRAGVERTLAGALGVGGTLAGGLLLGDEAFVEEDVEGGGDRDGHQGADQAEDGGADEAGDEDGGRAALRSEER